MNCNKALGLIVSPILVMSLITCGACISTPGPIPVNTSTREPVATSTVPPPPSGTAFMLDGFDGRRSQTINCSPFLTEKAVMSEGYCIFYDNAKVQVSLTSSQGEDRGLLITYDLGNWLSVRRETGNLIDLSSYSGVRLRFRVEKPADVVLRITLADVASVTHVGVKGRDELWWCDHQDLLNNPSGTWQTAVCPFRDFHEGGGIGTRHNDSNLDLARIVACEISIVSEAEARTEGSIVVDSLEAFK